MERSYLNLYEHSGIIKQNFIHTASTKVFSATLSMRQQQSSINMYSLRRILTLGLDTTHKDMLHLLTFITLVTPLSVYIRAMLSRKDLHK